MNFLEAIKELEKGNRISLPEWKDCGYYVTLNNSKTYLLLTKNNLDHFDINADFYKRDDWEIYQETFDFQTAIKYIKQWKSVKRLAWNGDILVERIYDKLCISSKYDSLSYSPSFTDMEATDWVLV